MADILLDTESVPATPAAGTATIFVDSTSTLLAQKGSGGRVWGSTYNAAIAAQAGGFAADTYVTDSDLQIPSFGMQARTQFCWKISASKTGAGVATPIYIVRIGSGRTVSDAARLTLTGPAQTAIADIGTLIIMVTVRNIGAAGILAGTAWWEHRGTAANTTTSGTGFANDSTGHVEGASAGFDNTAAAMAGFYVGLSINGGASAVWSPTQVWAEANW